MQKTISDIKEQLLFLHAVSGGYTTSCLYKKGKLAAVKVLQKYTQLKENVSVSLAGCKE